MQPHRENMNTEQDQRTQERERAELHKTIWGIADKLRGAVSGWDFKQYVLGTLFYRFLSEKIARVADEEQRAAGDAGFSYAALPDEDALPAKDILVRKIGFFLSPSHLFSRVHDAAAKDDNLNVTLENVFREIENSAKGTESEDDFKDIFSAIDFGDARKLGATVDKQNKTLRALLDGVAQMRFGDFQGGAIDLFGDAYEFLLTMYASSAGKSGGEFFTPQEVSRLLARLATRGRTRVNRVYDPACGSGSLLMQVAKVLGRENVLGGFFGQEKEPTTHNLCRINLFLHDIDPRKFDIALGDTLLDPAESHADAEPFDVVVSNPPYSLEWEGDSNPLLVADPRFAPAGVLAPKDKADFAFILHALSWLAPDGAAAIVCFPGIFYRRGAEQKIRQYLVDNNYVDAVIALPPNLFFGVGIATTILVLRKNKRNDTGVLFVDGTREFVKAGNKNKLAPENIDALFSLYDERRDAPHRARLVPFEEIAANGYNLSPSTYVEPEDTREEVDLAALNAEIKAAAARVDALRAEADAIAAEAIGEEENS